MSVFEPQKVTIVGSGIVGAFAALKIKSEFPNSQITILEAGNNIPVEATEKQVKSEVLYSWSLTEGISGNSKLWGGLLAKIDYFSFESNKIKGFKSYNELVENYNAVCNYLGWNNFPAMQNKEEAFCLKYFCGETLPTISENILSKLDCTVIPNSKVISIKKGHGKVILELDKNIKYHVEGPLFLACNAIENVRLACSALKYDRYDAPYVNHSKGHIATFTTNIASNTLSEFVGYVEHGQKKFAGIVAANDPMRKFVFRIEPEYPWSDNYSLTILLKFLLKIKIIIKGLTKSSLRRKIVSLGNVEYENDKTLKFKISDLGTLFFYLLVRLKIVDYSTNKYRILCYYEHFSRVLLSKASDKKKHKVSLKDYNFPFAEVVNSVNMMVSSDWFKTKFEPHQVTYIPNAKQIRLDSSHHAATTHELTNEDSQVASTKIWILGASELNHLSGSNPTFTALAQANKIINKLICKNSNEDKL